MMDIQMSENGQNKGQCSYLSNDLALRWSLDYSIQTQRHGRKLVELVDA